jgi:hypothetical protein
MVLAMGGLPLLPLFVSIRFEQHKLFQGAESQGGKEVRTKEQGAWE